MNDHADACGPDDVPLGWRTMAAACALGFLGGLLWLLILAGVRSLVGWGK